MDMIYHFVTAPGHAQARMGQRRATCMAMYIHCRARLQLNLGLTGRVKHNFFSQYCIVVTHYYSLTGWEQIILGEQFPPLTRQIVIIRPSW